mgnify:CR=1 FL=1|tara:strand:- start:33080 stop:34180 length:1101 start_codon:yes stop_codon:yes gene_type:complete
MASDVGGTIHIIAEVMGDASSPLAGQGEAVGPRQRKQQREEAKTIFGMTISALTIIKALTIGGLLRYSKVISMTVNSMMFMLGIFLDIFLLPLTPMIMRVFNTVFPILGYLDKLRTGEKSWGDIWGDIGKWWNKQYHEHGFFGALKEIFATMTGGVVLAFLFASVVPGLSGKWVLNNVFKILGGRFLWNELTSWFGFKKTYTARKKNMEAMKRGRKLKHGLLTTKSMMAHYWDKGAYLLKENMRRALDLAVDLSTTFGGRLWKALAFRGRMVIPILSALLGGLGLAKLGKYGTLALLLGAILYVSAMTAKEAVEKVKEYLPQVDIPDMPNMTEIPDWIQQTINNLDEALSGNWGTPEISGTRNLGQ